MKDISNLKMKFEIKIRMEYKKTRKKYQKNTRECQKIRGNIKN